MKLYVCWGTFPVPWPRKSASWRPGAHPCKRAYDALKAAGHSPEVVKVYGFGSWPDVTSGRKEVTRLTGESWVPVLVLDDGEVVRESENIVVWARDNPGLSEAVSASAPEGVPGYIPALRWHALTPLFDAVVRTTMRETRVKRELLDQADISPGESVLDLGLWHGNPCATARGAVSRGCGHGPRCRPGCACTRSQESRGR